MHLPPQLASVLGLARSLLFAPLLFLQGAPPAAGQSAEAPTRRPNLLLLVSDDQRWDALGCAGSPLARTPHLDALAADGVRFREAFVTTPICAASRASILTGLHERAHGFTFGTPPLRAELVASSYPARLRAAGYRTGFVGKFGVRVEAGGAAQMFDSFETLSPNPYHKKQPDGTLRHVTDLSCDRAVEFLDSCSADQPWCLSLSFNAPHAEDGDPQQYFWPAAQDEWYTDTVFPAPKSMAAPFFEAQPEFLRTSESRVRFGWRFDDPEKYQRMVRGYYRMISGVDAAVGRLRLALEARGFADDTVIVYCSDNGYFLGERGFAGKWYAYEPSLRIPLIVYDPRLEGLRRGATCDLMALNIDLAPTLLELAGVDAPPGDHARSLAPLVRGKAPLDWRTDFYHEHRFVHARIPRSEGVRTERFTYIRWLDRTPLVEELYDHRADFDELYDLSRDPVYGAALAELRQRTDALGAPVATLKTEDD